MASVAPETIMLLRKYCRNSVRKAAP